MPFDPSQPYEPVGGGTAVAQGFDPNKPFETVAPQSRFDPNRPFEVVQAPPPSSTPATDDAADPFQGTAPNFASPIEERTKAFVQNLGIPYNVESLKEAGKFLIRSPVQDIKDIGTALYELPGKIANIGQTIQTSPAATVARAPLSPEAFGVYGTAAGLLLPAGERLVRGVEPSGVSRMPEPSAPSEAGPSGQIPPPTEVQYRPSSQRPPVEPVVAPEAARVEGTPEMARVQPEQVVNLSDPNTPFEHRGPSLALKLDDGTVIYANDLRLHSQVLERSGVDPSRVVDSGVYRPLSKVFESKTPDTVTVYPRPEVAPATEAATVEPTGAATAIPEEALTQPPTPEEVTQYASSQPSTAGVPVSQVREGVGEAPPLRQPGETAPVQGDVRGGAAEPKAQAPVIEKDAGGNLATRVSVGGKPLIIKVTPNGGILFRAIHEYPGGETHQLSTTGAGAFKTMNEIVPVIQDLVRAKLKENPNQTFWFNAEPGRTTLYQRYLKKAGIEAEPQVPFKIPEDHPLRQAVKPAEPAPQEAPVSGISTERLQQIYGKDAVQIIKGKSPQAWKAIGAADPRDPYAVLEKARQQGIATPADAANLRNEHARLLADARASYGTPEYAAKAQAAVDMANAIKQVAHGPASDLMRGFQETDIPRYDSPADFDNIVRERMNRESTPEEKATFQQHTDEIRNGDTQAKQAATDARTRLRQSRPRAAKEPMKFEDAADYIRKQIEELTKDCAL